MMAESKVLVYNCSRTLSTHVLICASLRIAAFRIAVMARDPASHPWADPVAACQRVAPPFNVIGTLHLLYTLAASCCSLLGIPPLNSPRLTPVELLDILFEDPDVLLISPISPDSLSSLTRNLKLFDRRGLVGVLETWIRRRHEWGGAGQQVAGQGSSRLVQLLAFIILTVYTIALITFYTKTDVIISTTFRCIK